MARRYTAISRAKFRCVRAAEAWAELVAIVREAAEKPGYAGPSRQSVERIPAPASQLLDKCTVSAYTPA